MLIFCQRNTITIFQRARHTTKLRTLTAIGTATGNGMADITLTAVTDAQCAMNKELQLDRRLLRNLADLRQRQLSRQHRTRKTNLFQKADFFRGAII